MRKIIEEEVVAFWPLVYSAKVNLGIVREEKAEPGKCLGGKDCSYKTAGL